MCAKRLQSAMMLFVLLSVSAFSAQAKETFSARVVGGQSFSLILPQQDETKNDLNERFEEAVLSASLHWETYTYLSLYGKVLHYWGDANPKSVWDRDQQKWQDVEGSVSLRGTWLGGGLMLNTNRDRMISGGLGLGYGYLDNPDDMLNSGHGQFNITADITIHLKKRWSLVVGWDHMSNGRQMFKRGGKDSEFYPNNGRDFWSLGASYRF